MVFTFISHNVSILSQQGMCFSLPTPENPFNDKYEKRDIKGKETKKPVPSKADCKVAINGNSVASKKGTLGRNHVSTDHHQQQETVKGNNWCDDPTMSLKSINNMGKKNAVKPVKEQDFEQSGCPSKFLAQCLNSVQNAMRHNGFSAEEDKPLFIDKWGVEFWKCYSVGKDTLETSGACSTIEQIAWIASTATDSIARKEKEGLSLTGPFLLFLVPSQEKAIKVCKFRSGFLNFVLIIYSHLWLQSFHAMDNQLWRRVNVFACGSFAFIHCVIPREGY